MKRAIISVSDKTGIVPFATELIKLGYEIISTGGTKKALDAAGLKAIGNLLATQKSKGIMKPMRF